MDRSGKQSPELGREGAEEELIAPGEQPLVADEELETHERHVERLSTRGPGALWHGAQVGPSWKMERKSVLNLCYSGSGLELRVGLSDHNCLL
jgi:hypothetical protein